jgi:hypothetical protein
VDVKTKKLLALEITDERVGDRRLLKPQVKEEGESNWSLCKWIV